MRTPLAAVAALLTLPAAQALTLQGSLVGGAGLGQAARVGIWSVGPAGAAGNELSSAPIVGSSFSLNLPDSEPPSRTRFPLRPETIGWPGVIGEVKISARVQSSDVGFFVYNDTNGNGRHDDNEALLNAFPDVQRQPLVRVWVSGDVVVSSGHGFAAELNSGWNTFLVDLGRSASVSPYAGQPISLRVQR